MIGGGVIGDHRVLVFLIFGEVLEQRFALARFEEDCCFLGFGGVQVMAELLEQGVVLRGIGRDLLLQGYFLGLGG